MKPQDVFCPNIDCPARGQTGKGNIGIHSQQEQRYMCSVCQRTFTTSKGTIFYRLRTMPETVTTVITLLGYGCPAQAIVKAFGLDERTVRDWAQRAERHCQAVHEHTVGQSQLDLAQVQADEIKVKVLGGYIWMALALMVSTRPWLGGAISARRDLSLLAALVAQVRAIALCRPLLVAVDGLASYVSAFCAAFRSPPPRRRGEQGRPRLIAWPNVAIVQVVKQRCGDRLEIQRRIVQGAQDGHPRPDRGLSPGAAAYVPDDELVAWGVACARRLAASSRSPATLATACRAEDHARSAVLQRHGFSAQAIHTLPAREYFRKP